MKVTRGRETRQLYALTTDEYFRLKAGDVVYDLQGARYKVTSVEKWAGRPGDVDIHVKYGLYNVRGLPAIHVRGSQTDTPLYRDTRQHLSAPKALQGFPARIGDKLITREPLLFGEKRVPEGATGVLESVRPLTPEQATLYHGGQKALLTVKFPKGGRFPNVYPRQVKVKKPRLSR